LGQLPDVYAPMGQTAENLASTLGITREDQDAFALRSQKLAAASVANGFFQREIAPYRLANGDVFATDQSVRGGSTMEGLADLQPIFREGGSVTAGNACPLNDGAAAVMIVSGEFLKRHQLQPLAKVLGVATSALSPEIMGQGPVDAIADLEARLGLQGQVDQYEINEAFAVQVLANIRTLKLDPETVNLVGGSIAIGHPYGMTGARIAGTLINSLSSHDHSIGIEAMCVAGGQGMAIALERTN
jgi:acetyl-CoA C-acetyltransferase